MEWISVNDRLPEDENYVLIADFKSSVFPGMECDNYGIAFMRDGKWIASTSDVFIEVNAGWNGGTIESCIEQEWITHWMPLPEPPK